jgi:DNA-directed RNA polymerase subunit RPC12/RpoP
MEIDIQPGDLFNYTANCSSVGCITCGKIIMTIERDSQYVNSKNCIWKVIVFYKNKNFCPDIEFVFMQLYTFDILQSYEKIL